jgi:hypothetical protein
MKILIFKVICMAVWTFIWFSTDTAAADFETLIDGYRSNNFPLVKLPWLTKEGYLESSLPEGNRIFTKEKLSH